MERHLLRLLSTAVVLVTVAGLTPFVSGGTIRHDRDPGLYLDLAGGYDSVGRIYTTGTDGNYIGSGTLIAPNWVLTAGHMVDNVTELTFTLGGVEHLASRLVAHPKWRGNLLSGYDLALVELFSEITTVAPAARYTGFDELGAVGTSVGFGMTGTGLTGAVTYDGQKRAGQNVIDALYSSKRRDKMPRILLSDFDNPGDPLDSSYGSSSPLDLEYLVAPGDSGGGVFIDLGSGEMLAGVHSFGASFDGVTDWDYGDISGHIRVSAFNGWIDDVLAGKGRWSAARGRSGFATAAFEGDLADTTTIPEPASMALLAVGSAMTLLRRRRKKNIVA